MYSQIITGDILECDSHWKDSLELQKNTILYELIRDVFFIPSIGKFISTRVTSYPYSRIEQNSLGYLFSEPEQAKPDKPVLVVEQTDRQRVEEEEERTEKLFRTEKKEREIKKHFRCAFFCLFPFILDI